MRGHVLTGRRDKSMLTLLARYFGTIVLCCLTGASYAQQTPAYNVVAEYIRQLAAIQEVQELSARELKASNNSLLDAIRGSTRIKLELSRDIETFKAMNLDPPFETLLPTVINYYRQKIELHDTLIEIASKFIAGPQTGVDYGKLTAAIPQISVLLEDIDKSLFRTAQLFCLLLVDRKPDSKGLLTHLMITTAQRKQLVKQIDSSFGARLSDQNRNYTVESAALMRDFLLGPRKSADEPRQ